MLTDKELKIAKQKYKNHIGNCCGRIDRLGNSIEFRLTFDQWIDIWLTSGHWHERGNKRGQYVMSRFNDIGHYEIGNVEIKTGKENIIENNNSLKWRESNKFAAQKRALLPDWQENQKLGSQLRSQNPDWREKNKIANQKTAQKPEWREKNKIAMQRLAQDVEVQEKKKLAVQKARNKRISCDNVIYESGTQAALALAPETRSTENSKICWLTTQMKKFPERYFYIT